MIKGFNGWNILWELEICLIARRTKLLAQVGSITIYDEHSFTSFLCSICSFRFTSLCKLFIIKSCDLISCFWWQNYLFWPQWKMMLIFMFIYAYYIINLSHEYILWNFLFLLIMSKTFNKMVKDYILLALKIHWIIV